jgi:hypothetical protein
MISGHQEVQLQAHGLAVHLMVGKPHALGHDLAGALSGALTWTHWLRHRQLQSLLAACKSTS